MTTRFIHQHGGFVKQILTIVLGVLLVAGCANTAPQTGPGDQKPPARPEGIKPYAEVITKEAKTDSGLFQVHRVKQKWFFEIPKKELDKEFLFVTSQAKTQTGVGYGGDNLNSQVVKWERNGDRILLRSVYYSAVSADTLPVAYGVRKATLPPVLMAFDIQAYNKDSSAQVVDVTDLFTSDIAELGLDRFQREQYKVRRLDGKRSFIEKMRSFPDNIEIEATLTYDAGSVPGDFSLSTLSMVVHHSMVRLPENPMMPRLLDERVGYFGVSKTDYGYDAQRAERRRYIARWRLEPKDMDAFRRGELVEPKKPITFYIDRGVPDKWRPYLKRGVESWQAAFEKAGFKKAIVALDPPPEKEDPDWSSEDARYATIRWLPSQIENAYGPAISDPRTGEILDADIGFFHNVMNLARNWYFVQAGPSDPRAQKLPLPDSLMGELLLYIAAHEVGHSLGFPHNMKASSQFPVDSLRSPAFTQKWGTEASIMDYGRFNYVAQPGDGAALIPKIGPYDLFATEWGYRPIPDAATPDAEKPFLNKIAARQETEPYLRFGDPDGVDPTAQTEDLGADPVQATKLGMLNLKRVSDMLLSATTKSGEDYSTLREMYGQVFGQRLRELGHVAGLIGGVTATRRIAGQDGPVHVPVSRDRQKEAMSYLLQEGFRAPTELIKPELLRLFEPSGTSERVLMTHRQLLNIVLDNSRLNRLITNDALAAGKEKPYTVSEMLADLRKGVWSELGAGRVSTDLYRRNLQRAYIEVMGLKLNPPPFMQPPGLPAGITIPPPPPLPGEARAIIRQELTDLDAAIAKAMPSAVDKETKAHFADSRYQISRVLFPEKK
jgi:hypothetical protein